MSREAINRLTGIVPAVLSALAFAIALVSGLTGWERSLKDEGTAAHLFQLLVFVQAPLVVTFLITADWRRFGKVVPWILLQFAVLCLAFGTVAYFNL